MVESIGFFYVNRMGVLFGQDGLVKGIWSQKEGLIQTGRARKRELESERGSHSDRKSGKRGTGVRKKASFRQEEWKKRNWSQKEGLIQTGRVEKKAWSQKEGLIQTGRVEKEELESERRPHSDRKSEKKGTGVRKRLSFRQEEWKKRNWSQKEGLIQTGRARKRELESERGSHTDRKSTKKKAGV